MDITYPIRPTLLDLIACHLSLPQWGIFLLTSQMPRSHLGALENQFLFFMVRVLTSGFLLSVSLNNDLHTLPAPTAVTAPCAIHQAPLSCTILSHSRPAIILYLNQQCVFCMTQWSLELCCMFCFVLLCCVCVHTYH